MRLPNPTLGNMIELGILKSNTQNNDINIWYKSHDAKYRAVVDNVNGQKQFFASSSADVSGGEHSTVSTKITPEAIAWRNKL